MFWAELPYSICYSTPGADSCKVIAVATPPKYREYSEKLSSLNFLFYFQPFFADMREGIGGIWSRSLAPPPCSRSSTLPPSRTKNLIYLVRYSSWMSPLKRNFKFFWTIWESYLSNFFVNKNFIFGAFWNLFRKEPFPYILDAILRDSFPKIFKFRQIIRLYGFRANSPLPEKLVFWFALKEKVSFPFQLATSKKPWNHIRFQLLRWVKNVSIGFIKNCPVQ